MKPTPPLHTQSILDDHFTFNTQTGELVLFSADPLTFVDALIEMWMYVRGFETLMGADDYWQVEFAIGAWKPVKDRIKRVLNVPVNNEVVGVVGLPPDPHDAPLEDPYPFRTMVSNMDLVSFTQMVRLAGRRNVRVNFPQGTDPRVIDVYRVAREAMDRVATGILIDQHTEFNRRLHVEIENLKARYRPDALPVPLHWQGGNTDNDAASGEMHHNDEEDQPGGNVGLLLGPPQDEAEFGTLPPSASSTEKTPEPQSAIDQRLAEGPFGAFFGQLFGDEE
ncbi:MAG: hypothetical protein HC915_05145 [Anaerolineae bacterium]|nr:hypothetical protein [Anaerolineae bacterium]